ncbi:MAG: hypothetical protein J6F31_08605 [Oscillospiraceae bacterium]|nr:hypothetical protein [Oscillospiraceae bacterium]
MGKKCFFFGFLMAALLLLLPQRVYAAGQVYLEDTADIYDESQEAEVYSKLEAAAAETGWNYGIYTTNEYDYDPEVYGDSAAYTMAGRKAEEIYDSVFGRDSSGVLFFCDVGYRYTVIAGEARDYVVGRRFDNMNSRMRDKYFDYDDMGVVNVLVDKTTGYYRRGPGSSDITLVTVLIPLLISVIISIIAVAVVNSNYKKLVRPGAERYMDKTARGTAFYLSNDRLVNERHYSYSNSSSSGGGHGGGGGFSGGHHGGGGFGGHR